jgi:hypothetical protein
MYAFGNLHEKCAWGRNANMTNLVNQVLEHHIHTHISSNNPLLKARAIWVYERYGAFDFKQVAHLQSAFNTIHSNLFS